MPVTEAFFRETGKKIQKKGIKFACSLFLLYLCAHFV